MLTFHLPSKRVLAVTKPQQQQTQHKTRTETEAEESIVMTSHERTWLQRDTIIKTEAAKCNYQEGDIVRPVVNKEFAAIGYGRVRGIVRQYKDWPKSVTFPTAPDKPLITLVEPYLGSANDKAYTCSAGYVRRATSEEITEYERVKAPTNE